MDPRALLPKTFAALDGMLKSGAIRADDWLPIDRAMRESLLNGMARRVVEVGKRNGAPLSDQARRNDVYRDKAPHKVAAHSAVDTAKDSGALTPQPCERCGATEDIHAHHADYSKPLEVEWLCRRCHKQEHAA